MKRKAHGAQKPRHINRIVEVASTAQRSDSPAQAINPDISWDFYCGVAIRHVYCVALVQPPRHIVLYAFVALTARALYPRPFAPPRDEIP